MPGSEPITISPAAWRTKAKIWLSPRPVPLPAGLVVKKGSNTRSRTSGAMPHPVSVTAIVTYSPALQVPIASAAKYVPAVWIVS